MVWLVFNVQLPDRQQLLADIRGFGWWSWLVFLSLYTAIALTPIPVTIMALTGGVLLGPILGSVLSVAASMLGSIGAYWLARAVSKDTVMGWLGHRAAELERRLTTGGFEAVFTLRILPGMPYWPVNYGAGAFGVRFRDFAVASAIASIPGQIAIVAIGNFAARPGVGAGIIVGVAWAVTLGLTIWAWRAWRGKAKYPLPGSRLAPRRPSADGAPQAGDSD